MSKQKNGKTAKAKKRLAIVCEHQSKPAVSRKGLSCPHCMTIHEAGDLRVMNTYPNGNRLHVCPACLLPFIVPPIHASTQASAATELAGPLPSAFPGELCNNRIQSDTRGKVVAVLNVREPYTSNSEIWD